MAFSFRKPLVLVVCSVSLLACASSGTSTDTPGFTNTEDGGSGGDTGDAGAGGAGKGGTAGKGGSGNSGGTTSQGGAGTSQGGAGTSQGGAGTSQGGAGTGGSSGSGQIGAGAAQGGAGQAGQAGTAQGGAGSGQSGAGQSQGGAGQSQGGAGGTAAGAGGAGTSQGGAGTAQGGAGTNQGGAGTSQGGAGTGGAGASGAGQGGAGKGGAGGSCPFDANEPNDTESQAAPLTDVTDCDSSSASFVIKGLLTQGDTDWYSYHGDDTIGCSVDRTLGLNSVYGMETCQFAQCDEGDTKVTCSGSAVTATSAGGLSGCCALDGKPDMSLSCDCGTFCTNTSATIHIRIGKLDPNTSCGPYSFTYHF